MKKLTRSQHDALDQKLFEYKNINRLIALRKLELETNIEHMEERVQTSHISKIPEELAIKFDSDIVLRNLYVFRDTVDKCYKSLDKELQTIFKLRWIDGYKSWPEIEYELNYSYKTIYKKRSAILETYAELSGDIYKGQIMFAKNIY